MADIDWSPWDASKAWANGAKSDDPAAFYNGICAGKKAGDPATQAAHALPYRYHPEDGPNAAGVRNALSRLPQTEGLINKAEAQALLEKLMKQIQAAEAKKSRFRAFRDGQNILPAGARIQPCHTELRGKTVLHDGREVYEVEGYATIFNRAYEMWDFFGPYSESVAGTALDKSLASNPDVAFLVNHRGITMARTISKQGNPTLFLNKDSTGLHMRAYLNPERQDVKDIISAIQDGVVDEMSFAFMINQGEWDDDYENLTITEADINRGDVSAVNYGANPYTTIQARATEWISQAREMPPAVVRAAMTMFVSRDDVWDESSRDLIANAADVYRQAAIDRRAAITGDNSLEKTEVHEPETSEPEDTPGGKSLKLWHHILEGAS